MSAYRVLIVEDDPLMSAHLETIVTETIRAEVFIGASAAEASAALAMPSDATPFDFAFLDVDVLDGTTYAFASTLAAIGIPFAFVSASNRDHVPAELKERPFIAKPYQNSDIAAMIKTSVRAA